MKFKKPGIQKLNGETVKVDDEHTYRQKLLIMAKTVGCYAEVIQLLNKYDAILKNCTNQEEYKAIASMGIVDIHNLINMSDRKGVGVGGTLVIDGKVVIDDNEGKSNN